SAATGDRVIPAGAVQTKLSAPAAGSTAVAVRVTRAPPATGLTGAELAVTTGGVFGGGTVIGTIKEAGAEAGTVPLPPTMSWKARFWPVATVGAMKVAFALFALLMVTTGSPGFTICVHWNGPVGRVLAVPSSVTVTPANGGFGMDENVGRATDVAEPAKQVNAGVVSYGNGLSWPVFWFG